MFYLLNFYLFNFIYFDLKIIKVGWMIFNFLLNLIFSNLILISIFIYYFIYYLLFNLEMEFVHLNFKFNSKLVWKLINLECDYWSKLNLLDHVILLLISLNSIHLLTFQFIFIFLDLYLSLLSIIYYVIFFAIQQLTDHPIYSYWLNNKS